MHYVTKGFLCSGLTVVIIMQNLYNITYIIIMQKYISLDKKVAFENA